MIKKLGLIFVAMVMCVAISYGQAKAIEIAPGGIGDELNGLYNLRLDAGTSWQNFIVIENTSGNWTAAFLSFRAHKCSVEVWDKVILLSPYDVFWLALENDDDGAIKMWSTDADTLFNSALPMVDGVWTDYLSRDLMDEVGDDSSLDFGHFEVIGMFQLAFYDGYQGAADLDKLSLIVKDLYPMYDPDGRINVMDVLSAAYYEFDEVGDPGDGWLTRNPDELLINDEEAPNKLHQRMVIDCGNVLTGNFIWGDLISAEMGMENMIASRNFRLDDGDTGDLPEWSVIHRDGHYSGAIVFHPRNVCPFLEPDCWDNSPAFYLNPDWASQVGPTLRDGDALEAGFPVVCCGRFNDIWSHYDVDIAYDKAEIWYNYFQESPFDAGETYTTDVVLAFKTKYLNSVKCNFTYWDERGYVTLAQYYVAVANDRSGMCNEDKICFKVTVWDMDELEVPENPQKPSPCVWRYPLCLKDEVNSMRFSTDAGAMKYPTLLYSPFEMGHFRLHEWHWDASADDRFRYEGKGLDLPGAPAPFGIVYFRHSFGDWVRSAMAEFHYREVLGGE